MKTKLSISRFLPFQVTPSVITFTRRDGDSIETFIGKPVSTMPFNWKDEMTGFISTLSIKFEWIIRIDETKIVKGSCKTDYTMNFEDIMLDKDGNLDKVLKLTSGEHEEIEFNLEEKERENADKLMIEYHTINSTA